MFRYPSYSPVSFAEYFHKRFLKEKPKVGREYFPLLLDHSIMRDANIYLRKLKSLNALKGSHFTVSELIKVSLPTNVLGFGPSSQIKIPFLAQYPNVKIDNKRLMQIFFAGALNLKRVALEGLPFVEPNIYGPSQYFNKMAYAKYALCPEGCDELTYRLSEAIWTGCVPVYLADNHVLPYLNEIDYSKFMIRLKWDELDKIKKLDTLIDYKEAAKEVVKHREYFTYEYAYNYIINYLKNE